MRTNHEIDYKIYFVHAGGYVAEKELKAGEMLRIDTGCVVAYTSGVDFDIEFIRGIRNWMFGGEGLYFATLKGPGKVWIQSLPISRMAGRILQYANTRNEEGSILGGLGNLRISLIYLLEANLDNNLSISR